MGNTNYDNLIYKQQNIMSSCIQKNKKLEDDIEELKIMRSKMKKLLESTESISSRTKGKIINIPDLFVHSVKLTLFSNILDAIKGSQYTSAIRSLKHGIEQIDKKIKEYNNQIELNCNTIKGCKSNISSLKTQKANALKKEQEKKAK